MNNVLERLNNKISYIYQVGDELFAVGRLKVFNLKYSKATHPNYVQFFNTYKENVNSDKEALEKNNIGTIMYILSEFAYSEILSEVNENNIISTDEFWNSLNDIEKKGIEKQIESLSDLFYETDVVKKYPDIREN